MVQDPHNKHDVVGCLVLIVWALEDLVELFFVYHAFLLFIEDLNADSEDISVENVPVLVHLKVAVLALRLLNADQSFASKN